MKLWLKAALCAVGVNVLGVSGAIFTSGAIDGWYAALDKPPGVPPNWVFAPVWTLLYTLMGIAVALVWHRGLPGRKKEALIWFAIQMVLNVAWTPVFFGAHLLLVALIVLVALDLAALVTTFRFAKADRTAAWLMLPYLLWLGYATWLNGGYWWWNRG